MPAKRKASSASSSATIGFEAKLWLTADKLRNNMDAAECIGATKLNISDTYEKLLASRGDYGRANSHDRLQSIFSARDSMEPSIYLNSTRL